MKMLKIILTLCVLSISTSLFAGNNCVYFRLIPPSYGGLQEVERTIIEYRERSSSKWVKAGEFYDFFITPYVDYLVIGKEYQFRVTLVSKYGPGEPSSPTKMILIEKSLLGAIVADIYCEPAAAPWKSTNTIASEKKTTYTDLFRALNEDVTKVPLRAKE